MWSFGVLRFKAFCPDHREGARAEAGHIEAKHASRTLRKNAGFGLRLGGGRFVQALAALSSAPASC